ncbi:ribosomal RNA small subunit methyltransferase A [Lewinellaceae bacterium SD302]|nr:ribosomal RNA small subunit methyltransferase A [Lewinellaceae bacterium SD302]
MRAKKSYGQHFLNNEHYAANIAAGLELTDQYERVLEVGPGQGFLTKHLLERRDDFELTVIDADRDMAHHIKRNFKELEGRIILKDFLKLKMAEEFDGEFGLIGNFPYNISSQIMFKMMDNYRMIPEMVGMFQKEVADRILAGPGSKTYGVLGVLVQARYSGKLMFNVGRGNFSPPPKVQSAVIRCERLPEPLVPDEHYGNYKRVVKAAFNQRRKMMRNSLKGILPSEQLMDDEFFQRRPEQVSVAEFVELAMQLEVRN